MQKSRIYGTRMQNLELLEEKSASYPGYLRPFMSVSSLYVCDPRKSRKVFHAFCPLSPKSDQHEISPYNINSLENIVVMRTEYVIREDESN